MSVHWALPTAMPMLLVLTLREASLVPATQAIREMESLVKVRIWTEHNHSIMILIFIPQISMSVD